MHCISTTRLLWRGPTVVVRACKIRKKSANEPMNEWIITVNLNSQLIMFYSLAPILISLPIFSSLLYRVDRSSTFYCIQAFIYAKKMATMRRLSLRAAATLILLVLQLQQQPVVVAFVPAPNSAQGTFRPMATSKVNNIGAFSNVAPALRYSSSPPSLVARWASSSTARLSVGMDERSPRQWFSY